MYIYEVSLGDARNYSSEYRKRYQVFNLFLSCKFVETLFLSCGKLFQTFTL